MTTGGGSRTVPSLAGVASRGGQSAAALDQPVKIDVHDLSFYYGEKRALDDITIKIRQNLVTAFIGPSGCGKSTFLRTLNRMNDIIPETRVDGEVAIDGANIYGPGVDVVKLRRRVGGAGLDGQRGRAGLKRTHSETNVAGGGFPPVSHM